MTDSNLRNFDSSSTGNTPQLATFQHSLTLEQLRAMSPKERAELFNLDALAEGIQRGARIAAQKQEGA